MFKNAEYRMSFTKSLKGLPKLLPPRVGSDAKKIDEIEDKEARELTEALSKEVEELRRELAIVREQRENELRSVLASTPFWRF